MKNRKYFTFAKYLNIVKWFGLRKLYWLLIKLISSVYEWFLDLSINPFKIPPLVRLGLSGKLIREFGGDKGHNIDSNFLGFGLIHYAFIKNLRPQRVLCVGSQLGFIPAIMAVACKENGVGVVDFVDAGYNRSQHDKHWGGQGWWKSDDGVNSFNKIGVTNFIKVHVMTTKEFASRSHTFKYSYIYIDGDHSYEGVKLDFDLFWQKLNKGGLMAFHDIVARGKLDKGIFGVYKFWNDVKKMGGVSFPYPESSGLGIIQKT